MGRASARKKAARAARAAEAAEGHRRDLRAWAWTGAVVVLALVGAGILVLSRQQAEADDVPPRIGDVWHAAYGVAVCGAWEPPLADRHGNEFGIHTMQDGLIHIHPTQGPGTGPGATLGRFADEVDLDLGSGSLRLPGGDELQDGDDCGGQPGEVVVKVWDDVGGEGRLLDGDPRDLRLADGQVVVVGFVPEGTGDELQVPPTIVRLQDPDAPERGRALVPLPGTDPITGEVTPISPTQDPLTAQDPADQILGGGGAGDDATTTTSTP